MTGYRDGLMRDVIAGHGLVTVLWDVETLRALRDPEGPQLRGPSPTPSDVAGYVTARAREGSIILLHGLDAEALPEIVSGLRRKGLEPTTVSDLVRSY
jgi:peptidoglycan/xylan/chitin deacetylase (PgdA/CDA1 family)